MPDAKPVRLLTAEVSNKIAAGEVVERPASALKELLENAIDAGATQIDAEIVAGGVRLVAVRDNGSGMTRDDAILAIERHATSKIREVEDIERIGTLGFRGEALAAIASVSRFQLTTCLHGQDAGTCVRVSGGKMQDVATVGCPAGTVIEVRDLFFNVPARRKFLRTGATELAHARTVFTLMALSHPAIGMNLRVDGGDVHRLPGGSTIEERIRDLFGTDRIRELRPFSREAGAIRVHGFAGIPSASRGDRGEQFVFVNGRATSASVVGYALKEAYHTLVPEGRYPVLHLFIELPSDRVDVNVHPTKREVRFRDPSDVRDAVIGGIRSALEMKGTTVRPVAAPAATGLPRPAPVERQLQIQDLPATRAFSYPGLRTLAGAVSSGEAKGRPTEVPAGRQDAAGAGTGQPATAPAPPAAPWTWCRVVGQVGGLYVLLETEDGYVVLDPHAAHERVLFERYLKAVEAKTVQTQKLLIPETVEFGARDADRLRRHLPCIQEMGFDVSEFGADAFVVDAVPGCFAGVSARDLLGEMSRHLEEAGARGGKTRWREEAIAQSACKAAVKARDRLTLGEMEELVAELAIAELPYTCPHGRPTMVFTSFKELERKFGRT